MVNISHEDMDPFSTKLDAAPPYAEDLKRVMPQDSSIRPIHYGGAGAQYEVFNVLEAWGLDKDFYLGNVIKYVARAGKKCPTKYKEDLEKALVYLQRRLDSIK
jgi:hypothetical protein